MADNVTIIKKIKKGGSAAHGGAWKVAYADFVTAMMAFFLLLWLLNSVTQEQLEGVSNYFAPVSISESTSGAGGMFGGQTIGEDGAMQQTLTKPSISMALPPPKLGSGGEDSANTEEEVPEKTEEEVTEELARMKLAEAEEKQFEEAEKELKEAMESVPALQKLGKSLLVDRTVEGLRIQIVDQEGLAMFPRGGSDMFGHTWQVLEAVANVVNKLPQRISIAGHTDATKFVTDNGYSNWELSAERANASRRALLELGVDGDRVSRVVGKAAQEPLLKEDPNHHRNRRLEIILLKNSGQGESINAEKLLENAK
ncbi:MAG: OmpA family protein [Rhodospirillales bacterium]|nr:OmpA family protein [Rhodospirillales bacterium]